MVVSQKSERTEIIVDRLDNTSFGLPALNTDLDAIIAGTITNANGADVATDVVNAKYVIDNIIADTGTMLQKATKSITLGTGAVPVTETLFTVTGEVECYMVGYIDTAVTSAGSLTLEVGIAGNTAGIIAQTGVAALLIDLLWMDATPATIVSKPSEKIIANGADIIHTIATADATAGSITYYCWWKAISADGNVVAA